MTQRVDDLKLFRISGFLFKDFYLLAKDEEEAVQEACSALTFSVTECKAGETDQILPGFWKRLFGR